MLEKFIFVDLTDRCNLRCKTCYNPYYNFMGDTDINALKKIFDFFASKGFNRLQLLGGEPLLYKKLKEIVEYAKKLEFGISLVTNGLLLGDKDKINILNLLDLIYVSFDGTSPEEHDYIRGKGSYNKTLVAIDKFRNSNDRVPIAALYVLNARRSGQPIFEWVEEIGFDGLSLQVIEPSGMALKYPALLGTGDKIWELLANEFNTKLIDDLPLLLKAPPLFKYYLNLEKGANLEINTQGCYGFVNQIYVDINANIYPCRLAQKMNIVGFNEKNLFKYPKNELARQFFKSKKELILPKICEKCKFRNICQPCHLQIKFGQSSRQVAACKWALKQLKLNLIKGDYHV